MRLCRRKGHAGCSGSLRPRYRQEGLCRSARFAAEIARNVRKQCDNFGLMVDLSHIPMLYESVEELGIDGCA